MSIVKGPFLWCLIFVALVSAQLEARVVERIRVVVNGDIITQTDVQAYRQQVRQDLAPDADLSPLTNKKTLLKKQSALVNHMVYEKLLDQEAQKLGLVASPTQINQHIRERRRATGLSLAGLKAQLRRQKLSWGSYKRLIQKQLTRQMFIRQHIMSQVHISEDEVHSYYMQQYKKPLEFRYRMAHILFSRSLGNKALSMAETAYQRLQKGENFNSLAQEYNAIKGASGGDLESLSLSQMSAYLKRNAKNLNAGQVSKIIKAPHGYQIIKVLDKSLMPSPHLKKVRPGIVQKLFSQALLLRLREYLENQKKKSFVRVNS